MFQSDVLNNSFVRSEAKTYRKGSVFHHTTGLAFRILEGSVKATRCAHREDGGEERVFSAPKPGGVSIFVTHPHSDYEILEDATIFAFPRGLASLVFDMLLEENCAVCADKGHITLPPPKPEELAVTTKTKAFVVPTAAFPSTAPGQPEPAMTVPEIPAAKLRMSTPPQSFSPADSIKPIPSKHPTMVFPFVVPVQTVGSELPPFEKTDTASIGRTMPRNRTRTGLPFPSTYVSGEVKDIVPVTLREAGVRR